MDASANDGSAAPHPEEMRASVDLTIGRSISLRASARATPAGLIAAAILVSAVVATAILIGSRKPARIRPHAPPAA